MRKRPEVVMAIAATLQKYLDDRDVTYNVISHEPMGSSWDTAQISHIPGNRLAKGILLRLLARSPAGVALSSVV